MSDPTAPAGAPTPPPGDPAAAPADPTAPAATPPPGIAPAAGADTPKTSPPSVGDQVVYRYDDPLAGETEQVGVVVDVIRPAPDDPPGTATRARVAWYAGISGPMDVEELDSYQSGG